MRFAGRRETAAIDALQAAVIDPSSEQSVTAVLERINAATLLETRQKQGRLTFITQERYGDIKPLVIRIDVSLLKNLYAPIH